MTPIVAMAKFHRAAQALDGGIAEEQPNSQPTGAFRGYGLGAVAGTAEALPVLGGWSRPAIDDVESEILRTPACAELQRFLVQPLSVGSM